MTTPGEMGWASTPVTEIAAKRVRVECEWITPEMAAKYLQANECNRPVRRAQVERLVHTIKSGHWQLTHQGIAVDEDGNLLDGHHRLMAIQASGRNVQMMVSRGLSRDAYSVIDTNSPRRPADSLTIMGIKQSRRVASAAALLWHSIIKSGRMDLALAMSERPDVDDIIGVVGEHPDIVRCASTRDAGVAALIPHSWESWLRYEFGQRDEDIGAEFMTRLGDGAGLHPGHPILVCRSRILSMVTGRAKWAAFERGALVIKAWNHLRAGQREVKMIRWSCRGVKRERFPLISA